ncbi:MAG: hypothetical protein AAF645_14020 [Myxococcota bacterium]
MKAALCSFAVLLVFGSASVDAQRRTSRREREAWDQLQAAEAAYEGEDYPAALRHLRAAWSLYEAPVIRFNQGKTLEAMQRWHDAADAYEDYLTLEPEGVTYDLESHIEALRSRCPMGDCEPDEGAEAERSPPSEGASRPSIAAPLAVAGAGGALVVGGFVSWALARADERELNDDSTPMADLAAVNERADRRARIGNVLVPIGAAAIAAGVVWLIVKLRRNADVSARVDGLVVRF